MRNTDMVSEDATLPTPRPQGRSGKAAANARTGRRDEARKGPKSFPVPEWKLSTREGERLRVTVAWYQVFQSSNGVSHYCSDQNDHLFNSEEIRSVTVKITYLKSIPGEFDQ